MFFIGILTEKSTIKVGASRLLLYLEIITINCNMLQFFAMRIKISAIYLKCFFITAKQYCLPISSSIRLTAVPP